MIAAAALPLADGDTLWPEAMQYGLVIENRLRLLSPPFRPAGGGAHAP